MALIVSSVPLLVRLLSSEYNLAAEGSNFEHWSKSNRGCSLWTQNPKKRRLITCYLRGCGWARRGGKKKKERKRWEKSITARHYCLRIQSHIQLLSSLLPSLLQTPMSGIVTISNSEGLTFNILSCQGLWNRWHISISSSLCQTGRMQTQHASIFDLGLLVKRKITNDTNNCVWYKLLFIFLCHNWIKVINPFFFFSPPADSSEHV